MSPVPHGSDIQVFLPHCIAQKRQNGQEESEVIFVEGQFGVLGAPHLPGLILSSHYLAKDIYLTHFKDKAIASERLHNLPKATQLGKGKAVGGRGWTEIPGQSDPKALASSAEHPVQPRLRVCVQFVQCHSQE